MNLSEIDAAILCGGLGKRLRPVIGDSPKVIAPIKRRPFLDFILNHLLQEGFRRVILLTGYKAKVIEDHYRPKEHPLTRSGAEGLTIEFSREKKPLGTGGAIKNARGLIKSNPFLLLNGDSFCPIDYQEFLRFHFSKKAWGSIVLSHFKENRDFGQVVVDPSQRILDFKEKSGNSLFAGCYVNAGIYCFPKEIFQGMPKAAAFSLEQDVLPGLVKKGMYGFVTDTKFVDIGTPKRYQQANLSTLTAVRQATGRKDF